MRLAIRANLVLVAFVVVAIAMGFLVHRFATYGQVERPAQGDAAKADQKPPGAYGERPRP